MSFDEQEFLVQLQATFNIEAAEQLQVIAAGLLELEKVLTPEAREQIVEGVFRAVHSLKGAASAVQLTSVESLCQSLEDVFASWKQHETALSPAVFDTVHGMLDAITRAMMMPTSMPARPGHAAVPVSVAALESGPLSEQAGEHDHLALMADVLAPLTPLPPRARSETSAASAGETVRISVGRLETHLLESEEMLSLKITAAQRAADLRKLARRFESWRHEWLGLEQMTRGLRQRDGVSNQADRRAPSGVTRILDFLDWSRDTLKAIEDQTTALCEVAERDLHVVGKVVDDAFENSKKLLLLPFSTLAASFPKLVRDLSRDLGKAVDLIVTGGEIEIDKRILEELKDPLIHLLRNSIDHGIESPDERARLGKAARATITLAVSQFDGNKVRLMLADDGAGIDTGKLRNRAVAQNQMSATEAGGLDESQARGLVFRSGLSTSATITQLSGRGLGLAIVREKAEKLGGEVTVDSAPGRGTTFRIILPATRARFRGILVEVAGRTMVVPTAQVERVARIPLDNVLTVEGRETISLDGRAFALVHMADVLDLPVVERRNGAVAAVQVIILGAGEERIAFAVDTVLEEQEVLVKPLRKPLSRVRNVAAATVLGSGQVVPILHVGDLLKSAVRSGPRTLHAPEHIRSKPMQAILVAEDSMTSRMLLKNILESAGYRVKTAVDGLEAFAMLRAEHFDLLVSDVEMPRLDGFDLTARLRADGKLAQLPVVLVSARETHEDRERGVAVGANAYLIKSGFDQSTLIETVRRYI